MATYHVALNDVNTGATSTTVNLTGVESVGGLAQYLQSMQGKLGREFSWPSLVQSVSSSLSDYTTTQTALETLRTSSMRNPSNRMFVTWEG